MGLISLIMKIIQTQQHIRLLLISTVKEMVDVNPLLLYLESDVTSSQYSWPV